MKTSTFTIIFSLIFTHIQAQITVGANADVTIGANATVSFNDNLIIESGGVLNHTSANAEMQIGGDFTVDGTFNAGGDIRFNGAGSQIVTGDFTGAKALGNIIIDQEENTASVELENNVELTGTLEFVQGRISTDINEIYVKNTAVNAITGHFSPNLTDGTYNSNDRFVEGNLSRNIDPLIGSSYFFPIGNATDFYNPVLMENLSGNAGKVTATFKTGTLGSYNFQSTIDCSTNNPTYSGTASTIVQSNISNTQIDETAMTGDGFWQVNAIENYSYNLIAYPNSANSNTNSSSAGEYRILSQSSANNPANAWNAAATSSNPCVRSSNFREAVGANFSGTSIFAIASANSSALPIELISLTATPKNQLIQLHWQTAQEINNRGFEIERTDNPASENWQNLGFVEAIEHPTTINTYIFDDQTALPNQLYYYRLKQMDIDDKFSFSPIVSAQLIAENAGIILGNFAPNPAKNFANLKLFSPNDSAINIQVFNSVGQLFFEEERQVFKGSQEIGLSFENWVRGIYWVVLEVEGEVFSQNLVVE